MLNNIKVKQTTKEITLNIATQAEGTDILKELEEKLPKLRDFYQNSQLPIKVTGKQLNSSQEILIEKMIKEKIDVEVKFDHGDIKLGLHTIKKTFNSDIKISETKYLYNSIRSGNKEEYAGSIVVCGDVNFGAEIVAGGNIVVLGTLRGVAHSRSRWK